jgi:DNA repair protein SbcC/Rad50
MLSKIFKKNEVSSTTTPAPKQVIAPSPEQIAAQLADKAAWEIKLQAAMGDDAALLAIAKDAPLIDIKHAAVEALVSEDALKRAEREFRDHDRRVHRTAKQRYEALVNRRLAAVAAAKLIETASVLVHETAIPANRLVELDRAWCAIEKSLLDEKQTAEYDAIWTRLSSLTRERGEHQLQVKRWLADADPALSHMTALCVALAEGGAERSALANARLSVDAVLAAKPAAESTRAAQVDVKVSELQEVLQLAAAIDARLQLLEALQQPLPVVESVVVKAVEVAEAAGATAESVAPKPRSAISRWRALLPIADTRINTTLEARFSQWQSEKSDAKAARSAEVKQHAKEESKAAKQAKRDALAVVVTGLVEQAETALTAGHLTETIKYLSAIDDACSNAKGVATEKVLQTRIEVLQAETARLKGWQHWGGGRVREDLVVEAEALATASSAEKLAVKQHADAIENLRNRWKELDKLGGATSRPLWQRFDTALKTAYLPVAAHLAKLKAVRQENLGQRKKLLDDLDAVKLVEIVPDEVVAPAPDCRALARALEHFQTEWRKCGPVEHTVPHKAQAALSQRMQASIARLEAPLSQARGVAQLEREKLVARAKALAADIKNREVIAKVREWQSQAKALPLMRQTENALWKEFKTATDAVFTQRDAMHQTRDAEFKANLAVREAIIARVKALNADTPATEIKRTLSDVDSEWRKCGDAPRSEAAKIEAEFRTARDAAQQYLAGSAKRGWHNVCDTLSAKLALCVDVEAAAMSDELSARWASLPALPAAWEKALRGRFENTSGNADADEDVDEKSEALAAQLLQLEAALEIESLPDFHAARRELKLRAMKAAIEGRQSATVTNADIERWFAEAIIHANVNASSSRRIAAIIAALRSKPLR